MSAEVVTAGATGLTPNQLMDRIEARLVELGGEIRKRGQDSTIAPVRHFFTPGLYIREITMPSGAVISSETHRTEHPFVVSAGHCRVYMHDNSWVEIQAPYFGITKPGSRRLLFILRETVWTTFHVTSLTDPADIEKEILEKRSNPLIEGGAA